MEEKVKKLESTINDISKYLTENGDLVINLVMRVASMEKLLLSKGLMTEEDIQSEIDKSYSELIAKAQSDSVITKKDF